MNKRWSAVKAGLALAAAIAVRALLRSFGGR
jgi:hypothetical protein